MNNKVIISKMQLKALYLGVAVLAILSIISFMIENHLFWIRVSEVRLLTGANNSMDVALKVVREPKTIIMSLLAIGIKYSMAVAVVLKFTSTFISLIQSFWARRRVVNENCTAFGILKQSLTTLG
jgi:hypothetical protein